ncbi:MAG TPA: hypothetical protein DCL80_15320 [Balneola sp.]|nr:hypothetical protein [Balneola sp.]MBF63555.1 hypothetical protein [Balneola sp.]HAH52543.1 hypothetical protein [Balneola sp.]HAW81407.1 hypothetical protein [Balneola sp.]HBZ39550.1 hypothetical protein [Balneola sp.]|tara:strand:- start:2166 stop:2624 length:459 start_codon:yes stop_codon:yes gene_type:complete
MRTEAENKEKQRRQRQAMIEETISLGVFDDRDHFKAWMKDEFKLDLPVDKISTEYTLSPKQTKLLFIWLKYFTGRGQKPRVHRAKARISNGQLKKIPELQKELTWSDSRLADFVQQQTGKRKLIPSLFKAEATKVITGMERILAEQPYTKSN